MLAYIPAHAGMEMVAGNTLAMGKLLIIPTSVGMDGWLTKLPSISHYYTGHRSQGSLAHQPFIPLSEGMLANGPLNWLFWYCCPLSCKSGNDIRPSKPFPRMLEGKEWFPDPSLSEL